MARKKIDGVVEAVHYTPDGQVDWVRAYESRGIMFSDRVLLSRKELIERLKAGKRFYAGTRIPFQGGTFEVNEPVQVVAHNDQEVLVTGSNPPAQKDRLEGVPLV